MERAGGHCPVGRFVDRACVRLCFCKQRALISTSVPGVSKFANRHTAAQIFRVLKGAETVRGSRATRGGCRKCGSGSHTEQTKQEMVGNGGSRHQQHRMNSVSPSRPVWMCQCRFRNGGMGLHVWSCVVVGEARGQQLYCRTARRRNHRAGGSEKCHLESELKPAMKDADLKVA